MSELLQVGLNCYLMSLARYFQQHAVCKAGRRAAVSHLQPARCLAAGPAEGSVMLEAGLRRLERATVLTNAEEGTAAGADALDQQPYWRAAPVLQPHGCCDVASCMAIWPLVGISASLQGQRRLM